MSIPWLVTNLLAGFLLPPLSLIVLIGTGFILLFWRHHTAGRVLIGLGLVGLWCLSLPVVADLLLDSLKPPAIDLNGKEADAIVILGGDRQRNAAEYGGDIPSRYTLERLRYGARLAHRFHKPVLVTGGAPEGGQAEAQIMASVLSSDYGIKPRWIEDRALNTRDSARYTADTLDRAHIRRIYLVTHAWHLARAVPAFQATGLEVVPAGTGYVHVTDGTPLDYLPRAKALLESELAIHEWIGVYWYKLNS